ncbi:hypothetical protein [Nonomuraea typhae]|uniref:hypothetical protein n=1 Tax=Nonomuraea typhae TaxID=2603600 RepID=UPI0012F96CF9|nr:hypothetical protein [Nonomuraea typhae]
MRLDSHERWTPPSPPWPTPPAGLIIRGREARRRRCRLAAGPLKDAVDWLETYRDFWRESYQRLDDLLGELKERS